MFLFLVFYTSFLFLSSDAYAYIGPGIGVSAIASLIGIIGGVLLALFTIIYHPIKRLIKRKKNDSHANKKQNISSRKTDG